MENFVWKRNEREREKLISIVACTLENFDESSNEQTKYLEDILPTIYPILEEIQKKISESIEKIDKIYLTGTLSNINNLDLYFQEY